MKTKNRILAMLLAVVLMFSALPFSVSADEVSSEPPTESTVESQPEETPAEDSTPSDGETAESSPSENGSITISDSSGDVPVLYAQDPFNTVKSEVEGGTNYMTSVGVTRESIVRELEAHEDDNYYLGTPYAGGDAQSPNGDASYNSGTVGMNCAGFISYVLRKAGLDAETTMEIMHRTPVNQYGSGLPYDWLAGASNYKNLIENGNISAYAFRTKQELLSSGLAEKGDIILMWWSNSPGADGADNHIGFFWGKASDDDVMWHSGTEPGSGNQISAITPKTPGSFYILIKIEPLQPKEYTVTLTKTSADVSITQGNSAYSLAGATYNVYKGTSGTGSVVATFTTDEAGHATLSTPLEDGTYSVKEVTPPKGYKLDTIAAHADINDENQTIAINPKGGLLIQKTSEDGVLEGFTFLVKGENYSETFRTNGAGKIYIENLAPGEYTITEQESKVTARYEIPASQTVTVTADDVTTVEFYNGLLRGKITGHKTGAEQAPLEGVTFGLFDAEATEFTEETAIEVTTTNESGEFSFEAPYGSFQVMELATLPGYLTMKEPIAVEVNTAEVELEPIANNQTIVHISKVDAETGEELPGATLELYGPDGTLIETWESADIPHVITGLPVGEGYVLKETAAPEGYRLAEDITFAVEETAEIQFVGMVDEPSPEEPEKPEEPSTPDEPTEPDEPTPDVPQTGGSRAALWVGALLILALGGLGITLILLKKQNKL